MSRVRSRIYLSEVVPNTQRRFGEATIVFPAMVYRRNTVQEAQFLSSEIDRAIERAARNREDMPPPARPGLVERLLRRLGWL